MQFDGIRATSFPFSHEHDEYTHMQGWEARKLSSG